MSSLIADGIGFVDVIDAANLQIVGAVVSSEGAESQKGQDEH